MAKWTPISGEGRAITGKVEFDIFLPPPLDKPMDRYDVNYAVVIEHADIIDTLNELIERQNALVEIVKKLALR